MCVCVCLLVSLVESLRVFNIGLSFLNDIFGAFVYEYHVHNIFLFYVTSLIDRSLRDHPKLVLHGESINSMT